MEICHAQLGWKNYCFLQFTRYEIFIKDKKIQENTFGIGWNDDKTRQIIYRSQNVLAINSHNNCAPANLRVSFASNNMDRKI